MKINNEKCVHFDVENKFLNIIWGGNSSLYTLLHLPNSSPLQRGIKLGAGCVSLYNITTWSRAQTGFNPKLAEGAHQVQVVPVHVTED